jgi:hypothetical protein
MVEMDQRTLHDSINLTRLVRRLEKSAADPKWTAYAPALPPPLPNGSLSLAVKQSGTPRTPNVFPTSPFLSAPHTPRTPIPPPTPAAQSVATASPLLEVPGPNGDVNANGSADGSVDGTSNHERLMTWVQVKSNLEVHLFISA